MYCCGKCGQKFKTKHSIEKAALQGCPRCKAGDIDMEMDDENLRLLDHIFQEEEEEENEQQAPALLGERGKAMIHGSTTTY